MKRKTSLLFDKSQSKGFAGILILIGFVVLFVGYFLVQFYSSQKQLSQSSEIQPTPLLIATPDPKPIVQKRDIKTKIDLTKPEQEATIIITFHAAPVAGEPVGPYNSCAERILSDLRGDNQIFLNNIPACLEHDISSSFSVVSFGTTEFLCDSGIRKGDMRKVITGDVKVTRKKDNLSTDPPYFFDVHVVDPSKSNVESYKGC